MTHALDVNVRDLAVRFGQDIGALQDAVSLVQSGGLLNNYTAARAPLPTDDASQGYAVGSRWLWGWQEWIRTAAGWVLSTESLTPEHFGASGDGVADDTAAIIAWLENGGGMTANGTYLVAAGGPNAGGVEAVLRNSITFRAGPRCRFVAGAGLDNDIIRLSANATVFANSGALDIDWQGGVFDMTGQRNSTSVPFPEDFPPADLGTSATTDGLYIIGYVTVEGVDTPAVRRCSVRGATFRGGDHWQTAGGDSGLFIGGARTVEVSGNEFIGLRDCGFYGSGLSSLPMPDASVMVTGNTFRGCMMGAMVKRRVGKVTITGNRAINTAECFGIQGLSGVTDAGGLIAGNVAENAWHVVRMDDVTGAEVRDNISINHGHKLANGTAPASLMNINNALVRLHGVTDSVIRGNTMLSVDPVAAGYADMPIVHLNGTTAVPASLRNMIEDNRNLTTGAAVREVAADFTRLARNRAAAAPIIVGANSADFDWVGVMDAVTTNGAAVTSTQTLKTLSIPAHLLTARLDRVRLRATGTLAGVAGLKTFNLVVQGIFIAFPSFTLDGEWMIEAEIISTAATSVRVLARLTTANGVVYSRVGSGTIAAARPWSVYVTARTHTAGDTVAQTLMAVLP